MTILIPMQRTKATIFRRKTSSQMQNFRFTFSWEKKRRVVIEEYELRSRDYFVIIPLVLPFGPSRPVCKKRNHCSSEWNKNFESFDEILTEVT